MAQFQGNTKSIKYDAPQLRVILEKKKATSYEYTNIRTPVKMYPSFGDANYAPELVPLKASWRMGGQPSVITLKYMLGIHSTESPTRVRPEDGRKKVDVGDRIIVSEFAPAGAPNFEEAKNWFVGYVAQANSIIQAMPDVESYTITAIGPEGPINGHAIRGQITKTIAGDDADITGGPLQTMTLAQTMYTQLPCVFNQGGKPNASSSSFTLIPGADTEIDPKLLGTKRYQCAVFEDGNRIVTVSSVDRIKATYWDAYTAIRTLVEAYDRYYYISPSTDWSGIEAAIGGKVIPETNVHGMGLLQAIQTILGKVGYSYTIEPFYSKADYAVSKKIRHRLVLVRLHQPTSIKPLLPKLMPLTASDKDADSTEAAESYVQRINFVKDASHVKNHIVVQGGMEKHTVVYEFGPSSMQGLLQPAWLVGTFDLDDFTNVAKTVVNPAIYPSANKISRQTFIDRYHTNGKDYQSYKNVYRTFVLNEDGRYNGAVDWLTASIPDLKGIGIGDNVNYVRRKRKAGSPLLSKDATINSGSINMRAELGIYNSSSGIDTTSWISVGDFKPMKDRIGCYVDKETLSGNGELRFMPWKDSKVASHITNKYPSMDYLTLLNNTINDQNTYRLAVRVVCSVDSDTAVGSEATDKTLTPWPYAAERIIYNPSTYQKYTVDTNPYTDAISPPIVRDNTSYTSIISTSQLYANAFAHGHGSIMLRKLSNWYYPGAGIPHTSGREFNFYTDANGGPGDGSRIYPMVVEVQWDFSEGVNKTELLLDSDTLRINR